MVLETVEAYLERTATEAPESEDVPSIDVISNPLPLGYHHLRAFDSHFLHNLHPRAAHHVARLVRRANQPVPWMPAEALWLSNVSTPQCLSDEAQDIFVPLSGD